MEKFFRQTILGIIPNTKDQVVWASNLTFSSILKILMKLINKSKIAIKIHNANRIHTAFKLLGWSTVLFLIITKINILHYKNKRPLKNAKV